MKMFFDCYLIYVKFFLNILFILKEFKLIINFIFLILISCFYFYKGCFEGVNIFLGSMF